MIGNRVFLPVGKGRTFVCGDLHGSFSRLIAFMDFIGFDKEQDRMISVGDLVDRGPNNMDCLRLLNQPWFYAVKGNHEQMMYDACHSNMWESIWRRNGGDWKSRETSGYQELSELAHKSNELPIMLTVEMGSGEQCHVIHAELFMLDSFTDKMFDDPEIFEEVTHHESMDGEYVIWGRGIFGMAYGRNLKNPDILANYMSYLDLHGVKNIFNDGLSHIYCGHSVMQDPTRVYGQTNLDTGAYKSYDQELNDFGLWQPAVPWAGLTITEPETDKFWIVKADGIHETSPVVIS